MPPVDFRIEAVAARDADDGAVPPVAARPAHFRILAAPGAGTADERALAAAIAQDVERLCTPPARDHPKQAEWMGLLRGIAERGLVAPRDAGTDAAAQAAALRDEVGRDLARHLSAPYSVMLDLSRHELLLVPQHGAAVPTGDQSAFFDELHEAEHFIQTLYRPSLGTRPSREEMDIVYRRLAGAADMALGQDRPFIAPARAALKYIVRDAIRDRGLAVRNAYLWALFRNYLLALVTIFALLGVYAVATRPDAVLDCGSEWVGTCWSVPPALVVPGRMLLFLGAILCAMAAGAWLSAAQRLDTNSPEVLSTMLSEGDPTRSQAFKVIGFGLVALLLLHTGLVTIEVGTDQTKVFTTGQATDRLSFALLTGFLLGLGERAIPAAVNQRAVDFVAALGSASRR